MATATKPWFSPPACQCCGGKGRIRTDQIKGLMPGRFVDCPDCNPKPTAVAEPVVVHADWPGGTEELFMGGY